MSNGASASAGESYVDARGILLMSIYLLLLCGLLFYCLAAIWPASPTVSIKSVEPRKGPPGTPVMISGTGFDTDSQVLFGDAPADFTTRISDTSISAKAPAHSEGPVSIQIRTPQTVTEPNAFTFEKAGASSAPATPNSHGSNQTPAAAQAPTSTQSSSQTNPAGITSASPVKLLGFSFTPSDSLRLLLVVTIVGALGSLIHVIRSFYWYVGNRNLRASWLLMYVLLPFNGAGLALLFYLVVKGGISTQTSPTQSTFDGYAALAALVGLFSQQALAKLKQIAESVFNPADKGKDPAVTAQLKLISVQPQQAPKAGGVKVRLAGAGFSPACHVKFGGAEATNVAVISDSQMDATCPPHAPGRVDVEVSNGAGSKASVPNSFSYLDLRVGSVSPSSGPQAGGTSIQILGTTFQPRASVEIGGHPSPSVSVTSDSTLSAITPPGSAGQADVKVVNADGSSFVLTGGFTYS